MNEPPPQEPGSEAPRGPADEAAEWAARLSARMREEAEDLLAEARAVQSRERTPVRKGLVYGLAGAMNLGNRLAAAARGAIAGARESGEDQEPPPPRREEPDAPRRAPNDAAP